MKVVRENVEDCAKCPYAGSPAIIADEDETTLGLWCHCLKRKTEEGEPPDWCTLPDARQHDKVSTVHRDDDYPFMLHVNGVLLDVCQTDAEAKYERALINEYRRHCDHVTPVVHLAIAKPW